MVFASILSDSSLHGTEFGTWLHDIADVNTDEDIPGQKKVVVASNAG
jgi:hypothetical protein